MSELIHFTRPDGKDCPAYLAAPANGGANAPAIVVIQEYWGLNPQIKKTADRLAALGYRALVPDLYRGKLAANSEEAGHMMGGLNFLDAAEQDIRGAVQFLKKTSPKVAVAGFCMGGALTILAALKVPEMDAGVSFYGVPPAAVADPAAITIPMSYHFASRDNWVTPKVADGIEAAVKNSKSAHDIFRYEGEHAFMNEARPEVYDAANAKLAWDRMLAFLKTHVG